MQIIQACIDYLFLRSWHIITWVLCRLSKVIFPMFSCFFCTTVTILYKFPILLLKTDWMIFSLSSRKGIIQCRQEGVQARRKVLKTGDARYTKGSLESELLGEFIGVSPKNRGCTCTTGTPPFRRPWTTCKQIRGNIL